MSFNYLDGKETDRLYLRYVTKNDIPAWTVFFETEDYLPFLGLPIQNDRSAMAEDWINIQLERYKNKNYGHLALIEKESGKFIGNCGVLPRDLNNKKEYEIGYSLIPEFWGKGYAIEAARFFRDFAFENNLADSLISIIEINNIPSQKVAERNGMQRTIQIPYIGMEVFIYRIFRQDWEKLKR